jgi:protein-disulfide isomerase
MALRTLFTAVGVVLALGLSACSGPAPEARSQYEQEGDRAKGSPEAPVVIVEYASVSCPACANFHINAMPTIEGYANSGDVRFIFREMIASQPQLAIAGFLLANCVPEDQYFDVIGILFEQQRALFAAMQQGRAQTQLQSIASTAGLSTAEFRACMADQDGIQAVQDRSQAAADAGIGGTPAFFINGERVGSTADRELGLVWAENDQPLVDGQGMIPYRFDAETIDRLIVYYLAQVEGGASDT